MGKLTALFNVLRAGSEVVDKAKAKSGTITVNNIVVLVAAIIGLLNAFDCSFCSFTLTNEQLIGISSAIVTIIGLFNNISTAATSTQATIHPVDNIKIALGKKELPKVSDELAQKIVENQDE